MDETKIYFAKMYEDVIMPTKRDEDAGFDVYGRVENFLVVWPNETVMVETGLVSAFSKKYVAVLKERGSTGTQGIGQRSGVIDSGYRGEWKVPFTNHSNAPLVICKEEKLEEFKELAEKMRITNYKVYPAEKAITQVVMLEVPALSTLEISLEEIQKFKSERGDGMRGSSGK